MVADVQTTVLMTTDAVGGVWQYSLELAQALIASGARVALAVMGPRPSADQRSAVEALGEAASLHVSDYALEWMPGGVADFQTSGDWLLELQAKTGARIAHLNGYSHAALDWPVPTVSVAHSCIFSWWRAVHNALPGAEWRPYYEAVAEGLVRASAVVAPSLAMAVALETEYGYERSRTRVIFNSSSVAPDSGSAKQPFALAAGRLWDKAKNLHLLYQIAPRLVWPVRLAGNDAAPDGVKAAVSAVRSLGPLPHAELIQKMRSASLFLHPALYEPFGLSVLEAARARCCLVLADIPSLRELWDGCAEFVHPQDAEQWTFEVNRLSRDRADRERFASRAAAHSTRYGRERMVSQYMDLYRSLLEPAVGETEGAAA